MDWLTFIATVIKALAWPLVVAIGFLLLRTQIATLVGDLGKRLKSAKGGNWEVSFGEKIDEVQEHLSPEDRAKLAAAEAQPAADAQDVAALPPGYIVTQAWMLVEEAIGQSVKVPFGERNRSGSPIYRSGDLLRLALHQELITKDEFHVLQELRNLRNLAAHERNADISSTDALRFSDIAKTLANQIRARAGDHQRGN